MAEVEPLQDSVPNRYAFESDDSEDDVTQNAYPNPQDAPKREKKPKKKPKVDFVWSDGAEPPSGKKAYVAIGQAGLVWASGLELSKIIAEIRINEDAVASVYAIENTKAALVLLKYNLPIDCMHLFASSVLATLRPTSVAIVDSYSEPAYISNERPLDPPIRFLQTRASSSKPVSSSASRKSLKPFSPPNLILSTSASFMNIIERDQKLEAILLLLPLPHIPRPPPNSLSSLHNHGFVQSLEPERVTVSWPESQIINLHGLIGSAEKWNPTLAKNVGRLTSGTKAKRKNSEMESMYI